MMPERFNSVDRKTEKQKPPRRISQFMTPEDIQTNFKEHIKSPENRRISFVTKNNFDPKSGRVKLVKPQLPFFGKDKPNIACSLLVLASIHKGVEKITLNFRALKHVHLCRKVMAKLLSKTLYEHFSSKFAFMIENLLIEKKYLKSYKSLKKKDLVPTLVVCCEQFKTSNQINLLNKEFGELEEVLSTFVNRTKIEYYSSLNNSAGKRLEKMMNDINKEPKFKDGVENKRA